MPTLDEGARIRDLIPQPRAAGRLPARRDQQRRPPNRPPAAPLAPPDAVPQDGNQPPHIDEYA